MKVKNYLPMFEKYKYEVNNSFKCKIFFMARICILIHIFIKKYHKSCKFLL